MQRRKKQLLGAAGLASVMAMTTVAYTIPSPDVLAVEPASASGSMAISVEVKSETAAETASLSISAPGGNVTQSNTSLKAAFAHNGITAINGQLSCTDDNNGNKRTRSYSMSVEPTSEVSYYDFDLAQMGVTSPSTCQLTANGTKAAGYLSGALSDSVTFAYRAVEMSLSTSVTNADGDPKVSVSLRNDVYRLVFRVFNSKGEAIFVNADGQDEPWVVNRSDFDLDTLSFSGYLPMAAYKAPKGEYSLVLTAYAEDGTTTLSLNVIRFKYDPDGEDSDEGSVTPDVPGTGSILKSLNISRTDFVLTGMIAFGAIAGFALYLIFRKRREE